MHNTLTNNDLIKNTMKNTQYVRNAKFWDFG